MQAHSVAGTVACDLHMHAVTPALLVSAASPRYVLNKYGTTLDDVEGALEAQRRAYAAAHDEELPLFDRLAIRLAFSYLLQYSAAGRRPSAAALTSAADTVIAAYGGNGAVAAGASDSSDELGSSEQARGIFATTAAVARRAGGSSAEAASEAARKGLEMLQKMPKIPLPILSRSTDDEEAGSQADDGQAQQQQQYVLTQAEERLVQVRLGCCVRVVLYAVAVFDKLLS